jgi:glutamyl-tRNA(Gln) amidotransferase subunit D
VGSQRSSDRPSSDAATNLVGVVTAAATAPFAEVVLGMHETTSDTSIVFHRGTKVRKCHTSARYAFQSVNAEPLARVVEGRVEMLEDDYRRRNEGHLEVLDGFEKKTALVKFHPGFQPKVLDMYADAGYKGLILEGTGLGHVSTGLFDAIERTADAGLYLGMTSQCIWGRLDMNVYTTGRKLQRLGVEPLGDMLPETAYVKLMWTLANSENLEGAKALMHENIAGEYSDRTLYTGRFG